MEKREILAVIIAAVGICMLIGMIRIIKGEDTEQDSSIVTAPRQVVITDAETPAVTTDYWDYVRALQSAASSESTDGGDAVSGTNNGVAPMTGADFTEQTPAASGDVWNGLVTIMPEQTLTENNNAAFTTTTTTAHTTANAPFFINVQ